MQTSDPACQKERVVPGTRRPDGTLRKTIRIRAGFRPYGDYMPFKPRVIRERDEAIASTIDREQLMYQEMLPRNKATSLFRLATKSDVDELTGRIRELTFINPVVGKKIRNLKTTLIKAEKLKPRDSGELELNEDQVVSVG